MSETETARARINDGLAKERQTYYRHGEADGWNAALREVERRIEDAELRECDSVRIIARIVRQVGENR